MNIDDDWDDKSEFSLTPLCLAYGDNRFVASGFDGKLASSASVTGPWTEQTITVADLYAVAYGGGRWVAGNYNATNPAGSWSLNGTGAPSAIYSIAYHDGLWVAVGSNLLSFNTTDPTGSWTTSGTETGDFNCVAYGGGKWVAVGGNTGQIRWSNDPTDSWSAATSNGGVTSGVFQSVAYGDGHWLAVGFTSPGSSPIARTTTDPTGTWSSVTAGDGITSYGFGGGVRYLDGLWVLAGSTASGRVIQWAESVNGPWESRPIPFSGVSYGQAITDGDEWGCLVAGGVAFPSSGGTGWGLLL